VSRRFEFAGAGLHVLGRIRRARNTIKYPSGVAPDSFPTKCAIRYAA
jgi:hypothetical protein